MPRHDNPFRRWLACDEETLRKAERTRLRLLLAGADLLMEQDFDALIVSAICRRAGVAHGTFYLYYSDRNALAGDLLGRFVGFLQSRMREAARQDGDPVRSTTAAYYDLFRTHTGLMKCLVVGMDTCPEAAAAFQRLNHDWARTVMQAHATAHGKDRAPNNEEVLRRAYALGGMVDQYLTALFVMRDPWLASISGDRDRVINTLTTLWAKGMEP